jgi:hypothetical protein
MSAKDTKLRIGRVETTRDGFFRIEILRGDWEVVAYSQGDDLREAGARADAIVRALSNAQSTSTAPAPAPDLLGEAREIVEFWENREHTEDFAPWRTGPLASARNRAGSLVSAHRDWSNATNDDYWRYVTPEVWADALARARAWKAGLNKEGKQ